MSFKHIMVMLGLITAPGLVALVIVLVLRLFLDGVAGASEYENDRFAAQTFVALRLVIAIGLVWAATTTQYSHQGQRPFTRATVVSVCLAATVTMAAWLNRRFPPPASLQEDKTPSSQPLAATLELWQVVTVSEAVHLMLGAVTMCTMLIPW
jgi:hypothetical protein